MCAVLSNGVIELFTNSSFKTAAVKIDIIKVSCFSFSPNIIEKRIICMMKGKF